MERLERFERAVLIRLQISQRRNHFVSDQFDRRDLSISRHTDDQVLNARGSDATAVLDHFAHTHCAFAKINAADRGALDLLEWPPDHLAVPPQHIEFPADYIRSLERVEITSISVFGHQR